MPIPINRTLVVGLGIIGRKIVHRLRRRLQEQYGGVPYVAFLTIYPEGEPKGDIPWTESEEIELSAWALNEFIAKNPEIYSRLSKQSIEVLDDPLNSRLGANLAFQRLAREGREGKIARTLETTIQRLFGPRERYWRGTSLEFEVARQKISEAGLEVPVREVVVYIIAALNDPVGSGILLDFAYALQQHRFFTEQIYDCSSVGVLLSFDQSNLGLANTYAALKELDVAMSQQKEYQNEFLGIRANYRPFNRACYFVELVNEAGYPEDTELQKSSYGEVMVAEWLRWMITHLAEVEVEMGNIESRLKRLEFDTQNLDSQKIPAYSSFGFAAGVVPVKELLDYFAYRLGGQFASEQCLLASPPQDAEKPLVENYWKERAQMDARSIADVMTEEEKALYRKRFEEEPVEDYSQPMQGRIALPVEEQMKDANLFADSSFPTEPGPSPETEEQLRQIFLGAIALAVIRVYEFLKKGAVGLPGLLQRIRFQRELQEHSENEHKKRLERKLIEEVIPSAIKSVNDESWKIVSSEPVGGVGLAIQFCQALRQKLSEARHETENVYNKLQGYARQGTYPQAQSMPFILAVAFSILTLVIPIKPPISLPVHLLLFGFIAFLGLIITISLLSLGMTVLGWASSLLEAFVLGWDLWGLFFRFSIAGTILFTALGYLYSLFANLTPRDPNDRPTVTDAYLQKWMWGLAFYTALVLLATLYVATGMFVPIVGGIILVGSILTALEYLWIHRRYQRLPSRKQYVPSGADVSLGIILTIAHTVVLGFVMMFLLSAMELSALPVLLSAILCVSIPGTLKPLFDYFWARMRLRQGATFNYGDPNFRWDIISKIFVVLVMLGLIVLEFSPLYNTILGTLSSRFRGWALVGLVLGLLLVFATNWLPRLQLYEFAFISPPSSTFARKYSEAELSGTNALKNIPGLFLTLWRIMIMSLLTLGVIVWMNQSSYSPLPFLDILRASSSIPIVLLGGIFASKYLYDSITAYTHRENLPTSEGLVLTFAFVILTTTLIGFSVATGLGPLGEWVDIAYRDLVLTAIVLLGGLAFLRYLWEYVNDLARIWYLVKDWVAWYDKMALQRLRIEGLKTALKFYDRMLTALDDQIQVLEQFKNRLTELDQQFAQAEDAIRDHILKTDIEYQRYVLDPQRAERIYHDEVLANIRTEAQAYFKRHPLLETWRWQSFKEICEDLKAYVNERFTSYWREHGVINFLSKSEHPTYRDLEREIGWLFAKACKPYWRYYGATHGEFFAYVGMPAGETIELKEAVIGLAGPLVGSPVRELVSSDPYSITSITFRHGLPLHLLSSMSEYQRAYEAQIESNPWLHVHKGLLEELPGLFPDDNEAERYRQKRSQRRSPVAKTGVKS